MIGIILAVIEFALVCTLLGLTIQYLTDSEADIDLSQLAAVLSTLYAVHRIKKEKRRERRR